MVIYRLLTQAGWGQYVGCAEDLQHLLEMQGDVVMEEARSHYSYPRTSVAIKQRPVMEGEVFRTVLDTDT